MMSRNLRPEPPANHPMPTVWSNRLRGRRETTLDAESAVSLACHLHSTFVKSDTWDELVCSLDAQGFFLQFEGMRLALVNKVTGFSLCTCASLGHSFASLTTRMGKPFVMAESGRLVAKPSSR